jgi:hypothetical protein
MNSPTPRNPKEIVRRIKRTCEMSAGIMRDRERTGGWQGAEKVARQFDRLAELASQLESTAQSEPSAARFRTGDRVEWTNMLQNTFIGSVREVASEHRYIVQFDDGTVGDRVESELRPAPTKSGEQA